MKQLPHKMTSVEKLIVITGVSLCLRPMIMLPDEDRMQFDLLTLNSGPILHLEKSTKFISQVDLWVVVQTKSTFLQIIRSSTTTLCGGYCKAWNFGRGLQTYFLISVFGSPRTLIGKILKINQKMGVYTWHKRAIYGLSFL